MTGIVTERGGDKRSPGTQVTGTGRPPAPGSQMIAMARVTLRFYAELNDFLPPEWRQRDVEIVGVAPAPVRHLIKLCGVPHTEVELIIRKGESLGLEATIEAGDRVAVYPLFEAFDVRPALRLGLRPKRVPRFLADAHLGALAKGLRLLGFDTLWHNDLGDEALVELSRREHRILLTRDRRLLMRRNLTHGCYIRPTKPREQVDYLVARLQLCADLRPFSRCMVCNGELVAVAGEAVMTKIPPRVWATPRAYWRCPGCERLYWRGSHWQAMCRRIDELCPGIERE